MIEYDQSPIPLSADLVRRYVGWPRSPPKSPSGPCRRSKSIGLLRGRTPRGTIIRAASGIATAGDGLIRRDGRAGESEFTMYDVSSPVLVAGGQQGALRERLEVAESEAATFAGGVEGIASAPAIGCPYAHAAPVVQRTHADLVVRKLLRIRERPTGVSPRQAVNAFRRSMIISTIRCTLTYLVFPFVLPALGLVTDTGVVISIVIGALAMTCDIFSIRRFFAADHKWRWHFSTVAFAVICLLGVLLVKDVVHMIG